MRTIFYATTVTALIAAVACSDNTNKGDAGPGGQICPTTIQEAAKTSGADGTSRVCHQDLYICVVGFQCGNFTQQATCTCTIPPNETALRFQCLLSNGKEVDPDTTDTTNLCTSLADAGKPDTCPTSVAATKTDAGDPVACTNAGQVCTYKTTCTTSPPPQDVCQCKGNTSGNPGLSWQCDVNACP